MKIFQVAAVTLIACSMPSTASPSGKLRSQAQQTDIDQIVFYHRSLEYHLVHGMWETAKGANGVEHFIPVGSEGHAVELGIRLPKGGFEVRTIDVRASGEVHVLEQGTVIIDLKARGLVKFGSVGSGVASLTAGYECDAVYSGVSSVTFSGGCWGPLTADPKSGTWEKKCSRANSKECNATVSFSSGAAQKNPEFKCGATGADQGCMSGNSNSGSATAVNAKDGTC